jgi:hypothetical protein
MPVGSSLSTGILLIKDIHWLWDRFHISINPQTWIVALSEQGSLVNRYSEYNDFELTDETINLLKKANIEILNQHYDKLI